MKMVIDKSRIAEKYLRETEKLSERLKTKIDGIKIRDRVKKQCYNDIMENQLAADMTDTLADKYNDMLAENKRLLREVEEKLISDTTKKNIYKKVENNRRIMVSIKAERDLWDKYTKETYGKAQKADNYLVKMLEKQEKRQKK